MADKGSADLSTLSQKDQDVVQNALKQLKASGVLSEIAKGKPVDELVEMAHTPMEVRSVSAKEAKVGIHTDSGTNIILLDVDAVSGHLLNKPKKIVNNIAGTRG